MAKIGVNKLPWALPQRRGRAGGGRDPDCFCRYRQRRLSPTLGDDWPPTTTEVATANATTTRRNPTAAPNWPPLLCPTGRWE
eukprot:281971-Pyramimonas_sp.AAC.1